MRYETQMDMRRFHMLLCSILLDAFNGIYQVMQRVEEVQRASKESSSSEEERESMYEELGKIVRGAARCIYTLDHFIGTFNKFLKYHLQWMRRRLGAMGKLSNYMMGSFV